MYNVCMYLCECKVRACRRLVWWVEIDKPRRIILYLRQGVPKCVRVIYGLQYEHNNAKDRVRKHTSHKIIINRALVGIYVVQLY